ncbi:hypothetical protein SAMN02745227_01279 [Anaerobranca californiensis DSM 14826]|jgi:hypothetical protein|uniref:Uncharacterized protein n=1 Tax=Anaerobranca californiensis DSM 14826 TaxID=1120989 RepID=A0A1M6NYG2_9FIRM|nr:hypothetical protein SAMN02745227_01279 [Anaerobranca californiensis DSM 14826]
MSLSKLSKIFEILAVLLILVNSYYTYYQVRLYMETKKKKHLWQGVLYLVLALVFLLNLLFGTYRSF